MENTAYFCARNCAKIFYSATQARSSRDAQLQCPLDLRDSKSIETNELKSEIHR
jgi:hypothetical protein